MPDPYVVEQFVSHLLQRVTQDTFVNSSTGPDGQASDGLPAKHLSYFFMVMLPVITVIVEMLVLGLANYTLRLLFFSLACVETRLPGRKKTDLLGNEATHIIPQRDEDFITSDVRTTLRHIQSEAGDLSMFRGLGTVAATFCIYGLGSGLIGWLLRLSLRWIHAARFAPLATGIISSLLMAQISAAWLHIIVSKPQHKFWFRRLPGKWTHVVARTWLPIVAESLVEAFIAWASALIPATPSAKAGIIQSGIVVPVKESPESTIGFVIVLYRLARYLFTFLINLALTTLLVVPVEATQLRVQASMLPEEVDTIIPIDRSFDSGQSPLQVQHAQGITSRSAWHSITRATYWRLVRVYAKLWAFREVLNWGLWALVVIQLALIVGVGPLWILLKMSLDLPIRQHDLDGLTTTAQRLMTGFVPNSTVAFTTISQAPVPTASLAGIADSNL